MNELEALRGIDVYLIDQLLKGRITENSKVLDAGCGSGRNIHYLIDHKMDVTAIDPNPEVIQQLQAIHPQMSDRFHISSIEGFSSNATFDFIICNAVLHFALDHEHFASMFESLVKLLSPGGILFIRMTSNIGIDLPNEEENGVYDLRDGSTRYLLTRSKVDELISEYSLSLLEPVKTVKVEELRSMTTLILRKS